MTLPTFADMKPDPSDPTADLDTPVLVVDLDVMERNLREFAAFAGEHGVGLRSHTKAHKVPAIARRQEEVSGGGGILCQKLSEAEVMARNGLEDILLVCPVVSEPKLERLLWVDRTVASFATVVDCLGNAEPLQAAAARHGTTVDVVVELDAGLGRMGVQPGGPAVEMADEIRAMENLHLTGLLAHDAHVRARAETADDYERLCAEVAATLEDTVERLEENGTPVRDVITGATAPARYMGRHPVVTELDPGRYVFNDVGLLRDDPHVTKDDCALSVIATVISTPTDGRAIVDAGSKTLSYAGDPMPIPRGDDDIEFVRMSSEHGHLDVSGVAGAVAVGDRLEFVVNNAYGAINLADVLIGVRDGRVEEAWNVEARGKVT